MPVNRDWGGGRVGGGGRGDCAQSVQWTVERVTPAATTAGRWWWWLRLHRRRPRRHQHVKRVGGAGRRGRSTEPGGRDRCRAVVGTHSYGRKPFGTPGAATPAATMRLTTARAVGPVTPPSWSVRAVARAAQAAGANAR